MAWAIRNGNQWVAIEGNEARITNGVGDRLFVHDDQMAAIEAIEWIGLSGYFSPYEIIDGECEEVSECGCENSLNLPPQ